MRKRRRKARRRQPAPRIANPLVIIASLTICLLLSLTRWPGMTLDGIGPNWFVIWVVIWSIDRTLLQGILAGLCLGLLQDGLTMPWPTHAFGLAIVGGFSVLIFGRRFWKTDLLMTPVIVMIMVFINDVVLLLQFSWFEWRSPLYLWEQQQQIFWISPLLSGIWTPAVYWPLGQWWNHLRRLRAQNL